MNRNPESVLENIEKSKSKHSKSEHSESSTPIEDTMDNAEQEGIKKDRPPVTPEEFVATLTHSDKLYIVVEGSTDDLIYKRLIASLGIRGIDYHTAGCRDEVFKVYHLIKRNPKKRELLNSRVTFIADQDSWVFLDPKQKPPEDYKYICMEDIIWTEGYSIENDLYVKGRLRNLVADTHIREYDRTLDLICTWYAFELSRCNEGENLPVNKHLNQIVSEKGDTLEQKLLRELVEAGYNPSCKELEKEMKKIRKEYAKCIRGKNLFQLVQRFLTKDDLPYLYGKKGDKLLAMIAILYPEEWVSNLKEKVTNKLPELLERQTSKVDKLEENQYKNVQNETFDELKNICPKIDVVYESKR